jgi:Asp-tRNA(Asn)/Glu-tRNA(Gln) amidotransferase A subunit family amidase
MPLQQGHVKGYDFNRMVVEFTMLNQSKVIFCAISTSRHILIDGKSYSYLDAQVVWGELATTPGLPATVAPIDCSESGLPIGVQIIGPYLEDRTTIAFAEFLEREFGGFEPPPGMRSLSGT